MRKSIKILLALTLPIVIVFGFWLFIQVGIKIVSLYPQSPEIFGIVVWYGLFVYTVYLGIDSCS